MGVQARRRWPALPTGSRPVWRVLVPVVCLLAGFGFAASARDSGGTDLRRPGSGNLVDLVQAAERQVQAADADLAVLQAQVTAATNQAGQDNSAVAAAQALVDPLRQPGGLTEVSGPGITVILDDVKDPSAVPGVDPNQLVVHQSDLQAVVNALWAGGAEAMSIADERVIATSAVRCVGNTLLLNGDVYSPPFRVAAIGPYQRMQDALGVSPGVKLFKEAAQYYGLGYTVEAQDKVDVPAYRGPIGLAYAKVVTK